MGGVQLTMMPFPLVWRRSTSQLFIVNVGRSSFFFRWNPSIHPQGLEESEEAEADRRVLPAGRLVRRDRPQPAEVPGVSGDPQQEGRGAGALSRLLPLLLLQEVMPPTFIFSKSAATVSAGSKSTRVKVWSTLESFVQLTHSTFIDTRFHVCWRSLSTTLSVQRGGSCSSLLLLFFQIPYFFAVMPSHHCCAVSCLQCWGANKLHVRSSCN